MHKAKSPDNKLVFQDINVSINKTVILQNVSGVVHSKEVLAVMGPSGSGKTTLLNTIAGRTGAKSGDIELNGHRLNKRLRRKMAYVLQEDLFYTNLTLWETLYFTAMLNLPDKIPRFEKLHRIDEIIEALDLEKCRKTMIGGMFEHGLSGGEKKRLSIGCELLTNPHVMLLDEPTSGLDSSTAYSLMVQMTDYAQKANKAIIVTIHQPSSQIYHLFSNLLLLTDGQVAYNGSPHDALEFFKNIDLVCDEHYNPADFMCKYLILKSNTYVNQIKHSGQLNQKHRSVNSNTQSSQHKHSKTVCCNFLNFYLISKIHSDSNMSHSYTNFKTCFYSWKPNMLFQKFLVRDILKVKESKSRFLSKYAVTMNLILSLACGLMWFQVDRTYSTIRDRMGFVFFVVVFWAFTPITDAILCFPKERTIMMKERAAGSYRLLAYYLAKSCSELPLMTIMPVAFVTISYWMAGFKGVPEFFATAAIVLVSSLVAQGMGFVIGASFRNFQTAMTTSTTLMLCSLIFGGYYSQKFPSWLSWLKYFSFLHYPFAAITILEMSDTENIM
ncbi:hypothetical protein LOTGIDRAFT_116996 [Lottia gigantea]|uniref:ABC transporter domain-containing protein n=1 Tax=Lottia gigantea TaxID=225164 RepID=V4AL64_LOTGI|nr:hypothetical protein LOTGIDRAFT_116996 [Lottia gigantea]ESO95500.1 hypothetical protein LOTGIDRAFT_116996 [Lottia gigantea]